MVMFQGILLEEVWMKAAVHAVASQNRGGL